MAWYHARDRIGVEVPPLEDYEQWFVDTLETIGFTNGDTPITYGEIVTWAKDVACLELTPFETETLKHLSVTYVSCLNKYQSEEQKHAQPPFLTVLGAKRINQHYAQARIAQLKDASKHLKK